MAKMVVNPSGLAKPSGFSHGIEARGRLLFLAGQTGQDASGRIVAPGDLVGQFRQALRNVGTVIEAQGGTLKDLVKLTLYVLDRKDYRAKAKAIGQAYRELMGAHYPAMTLIEVKALWDDEALIEIDGIAVLENSERDDPLRDLPH
ncbi:MAG TPA: RidA family protein [Methylomirabilota bacterium]|jgi:enamine deaminase RidA (YjgF/YER057c/UK114 family)|nr:RidA family protein [Methylomirabilota bacterium]